MMFLLRTAFWVTVGLALLPSFVPKQATTVPVGAGAGAADAMTAASATLADLSGFCVRRPDACTAGTQAVTAFGQRIRAGTTILYDLVNDRLKTERTAASGSGSAANAGAEGPSAEGTKSSRHTLTAGDMSPAWQGPHPRKDPMAKRSS